MLLGLVLGGCRVAGRGWAVGVEFIHHNRILQRSSSTTLLVWGVVVVCAGELAWGGLFLAAVLRAGGVRTGDSEQGERSPAVVADAVVAGERRGALRAGGEVPTPAPSRRSRR